MKRVGVLLFAFALVATACGGSSDDGGSLAADAGEDFTIAIGDMPQFNGCSSTGEITNFEWNIIDAPTDDGAPQMIREVDPNCGFVLESAMVADDVGEWVIELTVTDGSSSASDTVTVTVTE